MKFLEDDSYIEYQSRCDLPYGKYKSSYNGCGWIAFYNLYGIIYYFTGHSLHYVAFERDGWDFVFHNVESKIVTKSMDEFEDKYIKFKHYILLELEEI